jgi:hypothetical protein
VGFAGYAQLQHHAQTAGQVVELLQGVEAGRLWFFGARRAAGRGIKHPLVGKINDEVIARTGYLHMVIIVRYDQARIYFEAPSQDWSGCWGAIAGRCQRNSRRGCECAENHLGAKLQRVRSDFER